MVDTDKISDLESFLSDAESIRVLSILSEDRSVEFKEKMRVFLGRVVSSWAKNYESLESPEREYLDAIVQFYGPNENTSDEGEENIYDRRVSSIGLGKRSSKFLSRSGINYVGELVMKGDQDLLGLKNFGITSLSEVRLRLEDIGLQLGMGIVYVPPERR
jgi:DNA-directed RNA polymerase alpha subunit